MSRIAVTGGSGASGRFIINALLEQGHEIVCIDRRFDPTHLRQFREVDMNNYGDVLASLMGCDEVVHFAAHPEPDFDHHTAAARFNNNTAACFNVFNAAAALGIKRVVWASSETVHGFPFEKNKPEPLPLTEESKPAPQNGYALSKLMCEHLAEEMVRLNPDMTIIGLRLSNILYHSNHSATYDKIPGYWDDPRSRCFNLWGYVDARDAADAVICALKAPIKGARNYNIAAPDTLMKQPSAELVREVFPGVPLAEGHGVHEALTSSKKAERELGWQARHLWRDQLTLRAAE